MATGYGCLESGPAGVSIRDAGVITTRSGERLEARLSVIHGAVAALLVAHVPSLLVVEDLYAEYKVPRTAIMMGHARGVICLAAAQRGVAILALAPAEVKRAIAAHGAASKAQVQRSVQARLGLRDLPRPSHVADALSLALTGLARAGRRLP